MKKRKLGAAKVKQIQALLATVPFAKFVGIELESIEVGVATLVLNLREELKQNNGIVHGGAIASLIDTATAFAIITMLRTAERATTVDLTIHYLRPLITGKAVATSRVLRLGRRVIVASAEVFDNTGKLVATAVTTYLRTTS